MNKEITPEIRQRIFGCYIGQTIMGCISVPDNEPYPERFIVNPYVESYRYFIEVKPLSSITDEDAIEVCKIITGHANEKYRFEIIRQKDRIYVKSTLGSTTIHTEIVIYNDGDLGNVTGYGISDSIHAFDFLRFKSYALPAFGYSVEQLEKAGVFVIKEVKNV